MPKKMNVIGQKFNRLIVKSEQEKIQGRNEILYLCQCECGGEIITSVNKLTSGNTTSCGCFQKEQTSKASKGNSWGQKYENSSLTSANKVWKNMYQDGCSFNKFLELSQMNCFYCNDEPNNLMNAYMNKKGEIIHERVTKEWALNGWFKYQGLDRVSSDLDHLENNIVPCCINCNRSKDEYTINDFISWVIRITNNLIDKNFIVVDEQKFKSNAQTNDQILKQLIGQYQKAINANTNYFLMTDEIITEYIDKKENIIGKKFGRLIVLNSIQDEKLGQCFNCLCDCGNKIHMTKYRLISGHTKSCGCYYIDLKTKYKDPKFATARAVWRDCYQDGCSFERFMELSQMNCFYCNIPPSNSCNRYIKKDGTIRNTNINLEKAKQYQFIYQGLDRIDSSRDHSEDNIVPSCFKCNNSKNKHTFDNFISWVIKLSSNLIKNNIIKITDKQITLNIEESKKILTEMIKIYQTPADKLI